MHQHRLFEGFDPGSGLIIDPLSAAYAGGKIGVIGMPAASLASRTCFVCQYALKTFNLAKLRTRCLVLSAIIDELKAPSSFALVAFGQHQLPQCCQAEMVRPPERE